MNINILGVTKLKWTGMGEFNSAEMISFRMDWLDLLAALASVFQMNIQSLLPLG